MKENYEKVIRKHFEYLSEKVNLAKQHDDKVSEESYMLLIVDFLALVADHIGKDFSLVEELPRIKVEDNAVTEKPQGRKKNKKRK